MILNIGFRFIKEPSMGMATSHYKLGCIKATTTKQHIYRQFLVNHRPSSTALVGVSFLLLADHYPIMNLHKLTKPISPYSSPSLPSNKHEMTVNVHDISQYYPSFTNSMYLHEFGMPTAGWLRQSTSAAGRKTE